MTHPKTDPVSNDLDVVDDLKHAARILHKQAQAKNTDALRRLRVLDECRHLNDDNLANIVRRRHCLGTVARELGFSGWSHAVAVFRDPDEPDFGTLLYPDSCCAHWNIWSANYEEAKSIRDQHGGYLLTYWRQFFIVDEHYIRSLGLDPDDPDWKAIGRDWARPGDRAARERLYSKLIRSRLGGPTLQR